MLNIKPDFMPVEIMELIVRANVQESSGNAGAAATDDGSSDAAVHKQALIEECVEQVLEILRHRNER